MKLVFFGFLFFIFPTFSTSLEFVIDTSSYEPMNLLCIVENRLSLKGVPDDVHSFVQEYIGPLLGATRQFDVVVRSEEIPKTKKQMQHILADGFPLALFFEGDNRSLTWRLYDTMSLYQIKGKMHKRGLLPRYQWALDVAETIWPELTSQRGSFSSLIVAGKHKSSKSNRITRDLHLIHPFYTREIFEPIKLVSRGNNLAPRWHSRRDVIFFSQHTSVNVRLMSVDPYNNVRTITSFDGQNMTPSLSKEGRVVMSLSRDSHTHLCEYVFDKKQHKGSFKRLTPRGGDFISPSFINEDEVVFCHINELNVPSLGTLNLKNKKITWLKLGRALCPAASPFGDKIAFCKRADSAYQLWIYDCATKQEEQITRCVGSKDECSWSPCGNYLVCCVEKGDSSRLAIVDVHTKVLRYITSDNEEWSYPSWSPHLSIPFSFGKIA